MSQYSESTFAEDPNSSWFKAYNYIRPKSSVLDIGCSSGTFGAVLIKKKGCTVDGIELDEGDFKQAKKKLHDVYKLNVETDNLSGIREKYDFIYFGDVIEHLINPVDTLERVKKLLNQNGQLIFSIPNMAHLSVRLMLLKGDFMYGETGLLDKTHLHFYTLYEIQRVFSEAGYQIVNMNPVLKDYPSEILEEELNKIGLKLTSNFVNFTRTNDASIYQYVGVAKPTKIPAKKFKLNFSSPVDIFQEYLNNATKHSKKHIENLEEKVELLKNDSNTLREQNKLLQERIDHRDNQIRKIKKLLPVKLYKKVRRVTNRHKNGL